MRGGLPGIVIRRYVATAMRTPSLLVSFLFPAALSAQHFSELRRGFLPDTLPSFITLVTADYDGDGDVDGFVVNPNLTPPRLSQLRNDGEGRFGLQPALGITNNNIRGQVVFDADADGDPDVVLAADSTTVACQFDLLLLRNQGAGSFTVQAVAAIDGRCRQLTAADLDGDGDRDLVVCAGTHVLCFSAPPPPRVLFNRGTGALSDATTTVLPVQFAPMTDSVAALDVTGDGRLDLIGSGSPVQVFVQQANGTFVATTGLIPHALTEHRTADMDGDGDLDLIGKNGGIVRMLRSDPAGVWTVVDINQPGPSLIRTGDLDGDGDLDLWVTNGFFGIVGSLWRNDGSSFTDVSAAWLSTRTGGFAGELVDTDGDGDLDLWHSIEGVHHNDGTGRLLRLEPWTGQEPYRGEAADVDGDGRVDLVGVIGSGNGPVGWLRNLDGGYHGEPVTISTGDETVIPLARDIDGDGDPDVVSGLGVWRNNGGVFTNVGAAVLPAAFNPPSLPPLRPLRVLRSGDVDGDADLDMVLGYGVGQLRDVVLINQGNGVFVDGGAARLVDADTTEDLALFDADGDGDLDLAMATSTASVRLFRNDGSGNFTNVTASTLPAGLSGRQVVAGDLDGDGRSDLVVAGGSAGVRALRRVGTSFVPFPTALPALPATEWPALADFDVDGDLDIRVSGYWLRNDGSAAFVLPAGQNRYWDPSMIGAQLADLDGDGDPDELRARNRHRQLENALPPRLGRHGELELWAAAVDPTWAPLVLLFAAPAAAATAMSMPPYGDLWLDPATLFAQSVNTVPLGQPSTTLRYLCPAQPALIGRTLWAQAFVMNAPDPSQWHFSNSVALPVRL